MQERTVTIHNRAGIHCRPSSVILNTINQKYPGHRFEVVAGRTTIELDSILSLISLGLSCNTQALLRVEGKDEEQAIKQIGDLFEYEFDFPSK